MFLALLRPRLDLIFFFMIEDIIGTDKRKFNFLAPNFAITPCWNFVHILGTPKKTDGDASAKFLANVSKLSAKEIFPPV